MPHIIHNATRQIDLATHAQLAGDPLRRLIGWLGKRQVQTGEGLILRPCSSIHMWGMHFAIDALYLDGHSRVLRAVRDLRPWRIGPIEPRAATIIELPPGTLATTGTCPGDHITFAPDPAAPARQRSSPRA